MAITLSVQKRARQSLKKKARNQKIRSSIKTIVKKVVSSVESKNKDMAKTTLTQAISLVDKARSKGVIHRRNASRKISRLMKRVNTIQG